MTPYLILAPTVIAIAGIAMRVRQHFAQERVRRIARKGEQLSERQTAWTFFDVIAISVLVLFSGLRLEVGTDYGNYVSRFQRLDTDNWAAELAEGSPEVGFTFLSLVVKSFSASPQAFFLVTSILTVLPVYIVIKRVSSRPTLAVALYIFLAFYLTPLNVVRQGMAVSLVLWAATSLIKNQRGLAVVVGVCAASIHTSAAIALVVMWLVRRGRPTPGAVVLILGSASLIAVTYGQIGLWESLVRVVTSQYELYLASPPAGLGTYLLIATHLGLLLYAHLLGTQGAGGDRYPWMVTYVLIGVALMIVGTQALLISRLALFFTIYLLLLLPERVAQARSPMRHDVILGAVGIVFYVFYLTNYGDLIPYRLGLS